MERKGRKMKSKRKEMNNGEIDANIFDGDFWDTLYILHLTCIHLLYNCSDGFVG